MEELCKKVVEALKKRDSRIVNIDIPAVEAA